MAGPTDRSPRTGLGRVESVVLGGYFGRWDGHYHAMDRRWLRLFHRDEILVPVPAEVADAAEAELARPRGRIG